MVTGPHHSYFEALRGYLEMHGCSVAFYSDKNHFGTPAVYGYIYHAVALETVVSRPERFQQCQNSAVVKVISIAQAGRSQREKSISS
jgi:hypothetical protein